MHIHVDVEELQFSPGIRTDFSKFHPRQSHDVMPLIGNAELSAYGTEHFNYAKTKQNVKKM